MKYLFLTLTLIISMIGATGCGESKKSSVETPQTENLQTSNENHTIKLKINNQTFEAILESNPSTSALIKKLPLEINMKELNGNEKYFYFNETFPTNAINPKTIQAGDLMLYGDDCLVLFYKSFSTKYSYTRACW